MIYIHPKFRTGKHPLQARRLSEQEQAILSHETEKHIMVSAPWSAGCWPGKESRRVCEPLPQGSWTSALLILGVGWFFFVLAHSMPCGMLISISGIYQLDIPSFPSFSTRWQPHMSADVEICWLYWLVDMSRSHKSIASSFLWFHFWNSFCMSWNKVMQSNWTAQMKKLHYLRETFLMCSMAHRKKMSRLFC